MLTSPCWQLSMTNKLQNNKMGCGSWQTKISIFLFLPVWSRNTTCSNIFKKNPSEPSKTPNLLQGYFSEYHPALSGRTQRISPFFCDTNHQQHIMTSLDALVEMLHLHLMGNKIQLLIEPTTIWVMGELSQLPCSAAGKVEAKNSSYHFLLSQYHLNFPKA